MNYNRDCEYLEQTFGPKTLIGNWFENAQLEEDLIRDFLEKKDRGELMVQRLLKIKRQMDGKEDIFTPYGDGHLRFGDVIQVMNPGANPDRVEKGKAAARPPAVLSISFSDGSLFAVKQPPVGSDISASVTLDRTPRNAFRIVSCDGSPNGSIVRFNQHFQMMTHEVLGPTRYLVSDWASMLRSAKFSRHQSIFLVEEAPSYLTKWMVEPCNSHISNMMTSPPVRNNERIIIKHVYTNQPLSLEASYTMRNIFGTEYEVSAYPYFDEQKAIRDVNLWMFGSRCL